MTFKHFSHPFTCLVTGMTGSGKTFLIRNLIKDWNHTFKGISEPVLRVLWCQGAWQSLYNEPITSRVHVKYIKGLASRDEITSFKPHFIVIDDLMTELGNDKNLSNLFTKESHHLGISVVFVLQNMYAKGSQIRNINLNTHYRILLYSLDIKQVEFLARQMYGHKWKSFMDAYNKALTRPHGYLYVNQRQDCPENLRLQTRITSDEVPPSLQRFHIAPIIYQINKDGV